MSLPAIELRFHTKETTFPTDLETSLNRSNVCYTFDGHTQYQGKEYKYTNYRWYYTVNDGIGCCYIAPKSVAMGYHQNDLEGVSVLFDESDKPAHVYFHAHSTGHGMWRTWEQCEKSDKGHLVVYVARNSHASYPAAKLYGRAFGFANDTTSKRGKMTVYDTFISADFKYALGGNEEVVKQAPTIELPQKSIVPFQRWFLPLTSKQIASLR